MVSAYKGKGRGQQEEHSQMFSLYLRDIVSRRPFGHSSQRRGKEKRLDLPLVVNGLDNESQRRADRVDVLAHDLLDNRRLPSIVQAPKIDIG